MNGMVNETRTGWRARVIFVALFACAMLGLSGCGVDEESDVPVPVPAAPPSVKPEISGMRLKPKAASASRSNPGGDPTLNENGDFVRTWNAGARAPQWIQLEFAEPTAISTVLLHIEQNPDGPSTHEIYGGPTPDALKLLATADGARNRQWVEVKVMATDVKFLKVATTRSPSWVAWHEIEVYK